MRTKKAAVYARVSTATGQSPEMQLAEMREYASRRGWNVFREYVDLGVSGAKQSRPELDRLMSDACRRNFDIVLCWKVDRFGRSLKHLVNAIADLDSYGVAFVSLRDNLDLSTPAADASNYWRDGGVRTFPNSRARGQWPAQRKAERCTTRTSPAASVDAEGCSSTAEGTGTNKSTL